MKTSQQWWNETKADPSKMVSWLQRQCYGEMQAFLRISALAERFQNKTLQIIADQEKTHHSWIKAYLENNGIQAITEHDERYWKEVNMSFDNLAQAAAVGHHAESMRLDRIRVIANDPSLPELQSIFQKILVDEEFHARAFESLSTEEELEIAKIDHEMGMISLGLTA